jgi:DNA-binding NarL/FixJ family response regulator
MARIEGVEKWNMQDWPERKGHANSIDESEKALSTIDKLLENLSVEEIGILEGLSNGKLELEIAQELKISSSAIKARVAKIYKKLEINTAFFDPKTLVGVLFDRHKRTNSKK